MATTVAAIATSASRAAIGVVRLTGPDTISILEKLCELREKGTDFTNFVPRTAYACFVKHNGIHIDEAMVTIFREPKSYTGEDMAEISCHGNPYIMYRIMEALMDLGAQSAGPGEFTKRAFMNGKLDLSRAEAVADVVNADNAASLSVSLAQLHGREKRVIDELKTKLKNLLSMLELEIDFANEEVPRITNAEAAQMAAAIENTMTEMIDNSELGMLLKNGARVVISGTPNAGKSSMLNALLQKERAIVTHIPGTTRDVIEDMLEIKGFPMRLRDTAGIHKTQDIIEIEGVKRAETEIVNADAVIFVIDGTKPIGHDEIKVAELVKNKRCILAVNKSDVAGCIKAGRACETLGLSENYALNVSAQRGDGIEELSAKLFEMLTGNKDSLPDPAQITITSLRHREALVEAREDVRTAKNSLAQNMSFEFPASDLRRAADHVSEITGEVSSSDLLELIFGKFCIGK